MFRCFSVLDRVRGDGPEGVTMRSKTSAVLMACAAVAAVLGFLGTAGTALQGQAPAAPGGRGGQAGTGGAAAAAPSPSAFLTPSSSTMGIMGTGSARVS